MSHQEPYARLSIADDQPYLICHVTRLPTLREYRGMLIEIAQAGAHNKLSRVLFDVRSMTSNYRTIAAQSYGEVIADELRGRFRVAMLVNEMYPDRRHLETVAVNRGLRLKYFTDRDQALVWLLGATA